MESGDIVDTWSVGPASGTPGAGAGMGVQVGPGSTCSDLEGWQIQGEMGAGGAVSGSAGNGGVGVGIGVGAGVWASAQYQKPINTTWRDLFGRPTAHLLNDFFPLGPTN